MFSKFNLSSFLLGIVAVLLCIFLFGLFGHSNESPGRVSDSNDVSRQDTWCPFQITLTSNKDEIVSLLKHTMPPNYKINDVPAVAARITFVGNNSKWNNSKIYIPTWGIKEGISSKDQTTRYWYSYSKNMPSLKPTPFKIVGVGDHGNEYEYEGYFLPIGFHKGS